MKKMNIIKEKAFVETALAVSGGFLGSIQSTDMLISEPNLMPEYTLSTSNVYFDNWDSYITISKVDTQVEPMTQEMIEFNNRFQCMQNSFMSNNVGFPKNKENIFLRLANYLCRIPFLSNYTSFNVFDECIDIVMKLPREINLSIARFLDEEEDNVVFSIHRGHRLIVSNELSVSDLETKVSELLKELDEKYA